MGWYSFSLSSFQYLIRTGNILFDLETNTEPEFIVETTDWILSSYRSGVKYYNCANNFVIGGYSVLGGSGLTGATAYNGQYFQRTYSSVPVHNQIYIQMKFFQIDSWDSWVPDQPNWNDYFTISIDGNLISGWELSFRESYLSQICGLTNYPDFIFTMTLTYAHSATSLTLKMIVQSNEDSINESFGVRDIQIEFLTNTSPYFSLCAPGAPTSYLPATRCSTSCTSPGNSITPAGYGFCFPSSACSTNCRRCSDTTTLCTCCQAGWYLIGTTCYPGCDYPLTTKTLGGVIYCETPCPGQYVWWDQSCFSSCSYTTLYGSYALVGKTVNVNSFLECTYQCGTNEFLYWNKSCLSSCPSPLIQTTYKGKKFCEYPCAISEFLYWNGSCISSCPKPLTSEIQGSSSQRQFCWYTCPETQYLYWNGSCLDTCPYPLAPETQSTSQPRKFCWYPCAEVQYLYWNGSCLNTCPSPLAPEKQQGTSSSRNFCWYTCAETDFLYWNGSCLSTCPSPLSPETQGTTQQRNFCWYQCSETQYLYWNESCIDHCPSPLTSEIQGTSKRRNFCWYSCQPSEYLYWNGSCIATCPSPLSPEVQGTSSQQRNFCWYPCQPSEYLFWNESCIGNCPYPLAPEIQGTSQLRNFCWFTCQPSEYLFWNGSCIKNCPSPLSPETQGITKQMNFCWFTCQPSEYLYWNQSCSSQCPIPLVRFDLSNNLFCFLPCGMPNIYWYQDFSCRSECNFPYNLIFHNSVSQCLKPCSKPSEWFYDLEKECHTPCNPPYIKKIINTIKVCHITRSALTSETSKIKSTVELIETLGKITSGMIKAASIPQLSTPRSALLIQLSSLIQYIRYMRINYPWKVQLLFQENDASLITLSFDFSIPNKIQDKFDNYPLPDVFEKYELDSNFINNMWDLINTVLLVILSIFALLLLNKTLKKSPKISHITTRILQSLRWNIPIAMISGGAGEIVFYSSLQIRNTPLDSTISIVSFFISLIMIFWVIVILIICLKLLRGFHLQRQKIAPTSSSETPDWLHKWQGYEILYEEIEEKYLFSLAYMVIYMIRAILFFIILANFYDYPLAQSILINVMNGLIFGYLLYYKPLKDIWNTIQLFINEILGNILTICVLILAIMDKAEIEARYSRETIGNVMIIIMIIFYILGVVFLVIEGILFLIEAYKTWKELRARGIKNPLKLIERLLFGEEKITPKETALELSKSSSRLNTSTIFPIANSQDYLHTQRRSSIVYERPLDSSSRFLSPENPIETQRLESEIPNAKTQNLELEIDPFQAPNMITTEREIESPPVDDDIPGFFLRESYQPNVDFIQNWGNLKARMKRFNQSVHKTHWPSEE